VLRNESIKVNIQTLELTHKLYIGYLEIAYPVLLVGYSLLPLIHLLVILAFPLLKLSVVSIVIAGRLTFNINFNRINLSFEKFD